MIVYRPYQRDCINAFYQYYDTGKAGNGVIVVPTAGGKSLIIGGLSTEICRNWPGQRVLILSHVRELILQNYEKVRLCDRNAYVGIYSSALGRREADRDIVVATIQSVYKKASVLGHFDLLFIDEVHLLQSDGLGMYGKIIADLLKINPFMKITGFTATDYRLDSGLLTEGNDALFDDTIIEISIEHLLSEGYLTPPISKSSIVQADLEGVKKMAGEFNIKQMAERFDQEAFVKAALDSDLPFLRDRKSIAVFCATLENAMHVADAMLSRGIDCEVIDGEMSQEDREDRLERFRSGELRALSSVGVITTGTDIPNMDAIIMFRATQSPGLYQQIVGRGFRVVYADGYDLSTKKGRLDAIKYGPKPNFLILDHGKNIERHGPVTHIEKPRRREKGERAPAEKMRVRICKGCRSGWPLDARACLTCGEELVADRDPTSNLEVNASTASVLGDAFLRGEVAKWFDVDDVHYRHHARPGAQKSMRVTYYCGILQFSEWLHFNAPGGMRAHAIKWWGARTHNPVPANTESALNLSYDLKKPLRIQVARDGNFDRIIAYGFQPARQESAHSEA